MADSSVKESTWKHQATVWGLLAAVAFAVWTAAKYEAGLSEKISKLERSVADLERARANTQAPPGPMGPPGPVGEKGPKGDSASVADTRALEGRITNLEARAKSLANPALQQVAASNDSVPEGCHFISERADFILRVRGGDSICFDGKVVATIQSTGGANYNVFVDYNVIGKGRLHCGRGSTACVIETVPSYSFIVESVDQLDFNDKSVLMRFRKRG